METEKNNNKPLFPRGTNAQQSLIDRVFGTHTQSVIVLIIFLSVLFSIVYLITSNHSDDKIIPLLGSLLGTIFGFYVGKQSAKK